MQQVSPGEHVISHEDQFLIDQLDDSLEFEAGDDRVRVYEVSPSPEKLKSDTPIVIGPGFMQDGEKSRELMFRLAQNGWRAVSFTAVNGVEDQEQLRMQRSGHHVGQTRKAAALLSVLDKLGIEKTFYIGHSEGTVYGSIAAAARPERFAGLLLSSPEVVTADGSLTRVISRFGLEFIGAVATDRLHSVQANNQPRVLAGVLKATGLDKKVRRPEWVEKIGDKAGREGDVYDSAWSRHVSSVSSENGRNREQHAARTDGNLSRLKATQALRGIAKTDGVKLLKQIDSAGVPVVIADGVNEGLFGNQSSDLVQSRVTTTGVDEERAPISGIYSTVGGHFTMHWAPDKWAKLADHAFAALDK